MKCDFYKFKVGTNWFTFGFFSGFYWDNGWWSLPIEISLFKIKLGMRIYKE